MHIQQTIHAYDYAKDSFDKSSHSIANENSSDDFNKNEVLKKISEAPRDATSIKASLFKQLDKSFAISSAMYFLSSAMSLFQDENLKSLGDKVQRGAYLTEVLSWMGRGTLDPSKEINPGLVIPTALSASSSFFKSNSFLGRMSRYLTHLGNIGVTKLHTEHVLDTKDPKHMPVQNLLNKAMIEAKFNRKKNIFSQLFEDTKLMVKLSKQAVFEKPELLQETFKSFFGKGNYNIPHVHAVSTMTSVLLGSLTALTKLLKAEGISEFLLNTLNVSPGIFAFAGAANVQNMKDDDLKTFGKLEQVANLGHIASNLVAYKNKDFSVMILQPIFSGLKNIAMAFEAKKVKSNF